MGDILNYLNQSAEAHNALQIMLFDDDSVEVQFKDKSSLQLSACGANFQFIRCCVGVPTNLESNNVIRQKCCFATSETRPKVEFALKWRNHFALRPYIPPQLSELYEGGFVHLYKDITSFEWPNSALGVDSFPDKTIPKFQVVVNAKDDLAKLILNKNLHYASTDHLVKICPPTSRNHTSLSSPSEAKSRSVNFKSNDKNNPDKLSQPNKRHYVWVKHIFPASSCPIYWKYPLAVAMHAVDPQEEAPSKLINKNHVPQPLPSVCKKQFEHTWRMVINLNHSDLALPTEEQDKNQETKSLKSLWSSGVMYWIKAMFSKSGIDSNSKKEELPNYSYVEAWLPDATILKSTPSSSYYFTHLKFDCDGNFKPISQRMYSPTALPVDAQLKVVILRAIRLRSYAEQQLQIFIDRSKVRYCWHDTMLGFGNNSSNADDVQFKTVKDLNEKVDIPCLGMFSAVSGSIQIWFNDGTSAYVAMSLEQLKTLQGSQDNLTTVSCRILFNNGHHVTCNNLLYPDSYLAMYIKPMVDWLNWLSESDKFRSENPFYSDTIFSAEKLGMISTELDKITRFNFMLEQNTTVPSNSSTAKLYSSAESHPRNVSHPEGTVSQDISNFNATSNRRTPKEIVNALQNTTKAISDIDNVIKSIRNLN